ncbi:N-acetylglucosamine kinase [Streptomyces niveus]|uniref:N-acetylglucosamine kinase n=1 Tax=Streptomyces niveus TaxID=193462 RepID=UPI00371087E0
MSESEPWLVGIDVGATGARARAIGPETTFEALGAGAVARGDGAADAVRGVLATLLRQSPVGPITGVAVGSTGLGTLANKLDRLKQDIGTMAGTETVVLAADPVTSHVGALGGKPGVTIAAGTGAIVLGEAEDGRLVRVDGWGHLLGDRGSAAWIGRHGLRDALRAHDGRDAAGRQLLAAARARFGAPETWPSAVYGRDDRAAILGSFAPDVSRLADHDDPAAAQILAEAVRALTESAVAALSAPGVPPVVTMTGGVLRSARTARLIRRSIPEAVEVRQAVGTSLDGAIELARRAATGRRGSDHPGLITW